MLIGSAVKIKSTVVIDGGGNPDSVTMDVHFPDGTVAIAAGVGVDEGGGVWSYIYQSLTTDPDGEYSVVVKVVSGIYTDYSRQTFQLMKQDC